jgi:hypothetical protein
MPPQHRHPACWGGREQGKSWRQQQQHDARTRLPGRKGSMKATGGQRPRQLLLLPQQVAGPRTRHALAAAPLLEAARRGRRAGRL